MNQQSDLPMLQHKEYQYHFFVYLNKLFQNKKRKKKKKNQDNRDRSGLSMTLAIIVS